MSDQTTVKALIAEARWKTRGPIHLGSPTKDELTSIIDRLLVALEEAHKRIDAVKELVPEYIYAGEYEGWAIRRSTSS